MKVLVLGSSGQIGKPLCKFLEKMGHTVFECDIKNSPNQNLAEHSDYFISKLTECDFCFYLASDVGGAKYLAAKEHSYDFIINNMKIMANVFKFLKNAQKPFIFTSSQMSELHHSSYGLLKNLGERITSDINALFVRLWNVYGKEDFGEKSHVITDFCRMAKYKKSIEMITNGEESRQMLYVEDCCSALFTLMNLYNEIDKTKNYHITSFKWVKIKDIAKKVSEISGCDFKPGKFSDSTQINAMNNPDPYILNFWEPKTSLEEGIKIIYNEI